MNKNAVAHTRLAEVVKKRQPPGVMHERVNTVSTGKRITRNGTSHSTPNIACRPAIDNEFQRGYGYLEDEYYPPSINKVHEITYGRDFRESILVAQCCEHYGDNHTKGEERRNDEYNSEGSINKYFIKYFIKSKSLKVKGGFISKKGKMKKSQILKGKDHLFSNSNINKGSQHNYTLKSINSIDDAAVKTLDKEGAQLSKHVEKASKILDGVMQGSKSAIHDKAGNESPDEETEGESENENIAESKAVEHQSTFNTIRLKIVCLVLFQWSLIASTYDLNERIWMLNSEGVIMNEASSIYRNRNYLRPMNPLLTVNIDFGWPRAIITILTGCLSLYGLWENNGKKTLPTIMLTLANIVFEIIDTLVTSCYIAAAVGFVDATIFACSSACLIFLQMYLCIGVIEFFERTVRTDWIKKQISTE